MLAWFHIWQAGIADEKLSAIIKNAGIDPKDKKAMYGLSKQDKEAAFYMGKLQGARFYIKNILPETVSLEKIITNDDLSIMEIPDESFASFS